MSDKERNNSYGKFIAWGAGLVGLAFVVRKLFSLKSMAGSLTFTPLFAGSPSYKNSELVVPISLYINNTSSGSVKVSIEKVEVYMGDAVVAYATIPTNNTLTIAANSYSRLQGFKIALPLNVLIQKLNDNVANIVSGNYDNILSSIKVKLNAIVGGVLTVSALYSIGSQTTSGLGLVAKSARNIGPLSDYQPYLPPKTNLKHEDTYVSVYADYKNTVELMHKVVATTLPDTEKLAKWLKRDSIKDTVVNIFNFVYKYIKYETDDVMSEQVRRPLRTLYDQKGDCDCYATLIASILTNLGINYKFRVAELHNRGYFQHVYIVVPYGANGEYYVCDPVLDQPLKECNKTRYEDL